MRLSECTRHEVPAISRDPLRMLAEVRAASKALPPPARMPRTPRVLRQASCRSPRESKLEERVVRRAATGVELMGPKSGRTKARSKPKVAPTRAPKQRPSKAARSDELGAKSRAGPRRQRKRKAEEAEPEEFEDPDEDSWSCGHDEPETVSEDDSEEADHTVRTSEAGTSESDRVYRELIHRGATPAIVGKQRRVPGEEPVEMELFTPAAARKARLLPEERSYRSPSYQRMPSFSSFFSF
ncbi:Uncharacterized protein SCF082_LOCUS40935 [Durusdinium trenchii]|uniref:Uncharacterized protein n=1 Tax=Durusdinium trenchii TaxID=1381693 RepID=A0ABP0QFB7_9DINO